MLLAHASPLYGQGTLPDFRTGLRTGIGYTAVLPDALVGVGVWHIIGSGRFGLFADLTASFPRIEKDRDYCPALFDPCTVDELDARRIYPRRRDAEQFAVANAGVMIVAGHETALLLGGGVARRRRFQEYADVINDPAFLITDDGTFWAPYDPTSEWLPQAVVAVLMRLGSRVVVRFGYETAVGGMSLGGYWTLTR